MQAARMKYLYPDSREQQEMKRRIKVLESENEKLRRELVQVKRLELFRRRIIEELKKQR